MNNDRRKFRVWCNNKNEWEKDPLVLLPRGILATLHTDTMLFHSLRVDTHIVEFCTGLKDTNGKQIFEGDIVKIYYGLPPTSDTIIIEYVEDETIRDIPVSGFWMRNIKQDGMSSSLAKTFENDLEIIGNIHENPELLKKVTP